MKTIFLKSILPVSAALVGIFGAFSFDKAESAPLAPEFGWYSVTTANSCDQRIDCDNRVTGPLCTTIHNGVPVQAYGKITSTSPTCTKTLRMPLN